MTEEMIHDRNSFRKFLDIKVDEDIPDETMICNFRNALMQKLLLKKIFSIVKETMIKNNLILKEGSIVDATLIHSSEPKRKKDQEGRVISNRPADSDATYTSKRGQKYHGYKIHIAADTNGMIKEVCTTTAKEADIKQLKHLTKEEKKFICADSAYMSKEKKKELRKKDFLWLHRKKSERSKATTSKTEQSQQEICKSKSYRRTPICIHQKPYALYKNKVYRPGEK